MPTLLLHLRQLVLTNIETALAISAVVALIVYVQFAGQALRARRHRPIR